MAKGLLKKEVLEACKGIVTVNCLNQIEAGKGWKPRESEQIPLAAALGVPEYVLCAPGLQIDISYGLGRKPKVHFTNVE